MKEDCEYCKLYIVYGFLAKSKIGCIINFCYLVYSKVYILNAILIVYARTNNYNKIWSNLACVEGIILNIHRKNSGKSYFKFKPQFKDKTLYYSYVFRRLDFLDELVRLNKIYNGKFYIEFTEEEERGRKLKSKNPNDLLRKVNIQNQYFNLIDQPNIVRINSIKNIEWGSAYNKDKSFKNIQEHSYNFHFVWERLKDLTMQLEV